MQNRKIWQFYIVVFSAVITVFVAILSDVSTVKAQYCHGLVECATKSEQCECSGGERDGEYCGGGCPGEGASCSCKEIITEQSTEGCRGTQSNCSGFCYSGDMVGNGCYVYYPPVDDPPVVQPPPSGIQPTPNTPPARYACNGCSCVPSYTGTDYASCAAACGPCDEPPDPNAGLSACKNIVDNGTAVYEVIRPGNTLEWQTWKAPAGATAWDRLKGTSDEQKITVHSTAPDDAYIFHTMIAEPESEITSFYLLNIDADAWYFYQGSGKYAVVFTSDQTIIDQLVEKGGYQLLSEDVSPQQAASIEKRVFRTPSDHDTRWSDRLKGQIPIQQATGHEGFNIPYQNCAESIGADDHKYFRISTDSCNPRGTNPKSYDGGGALPAGNYGTGAYFGMSNDLRMARLTGPNWHLAYDEFPQEWPSDWDGQTNIEDYFIKFRGSNPDDRYWDDIFFALMSGDRSAYLKSITMKVSKYALRWDPDPTDDDDIENRLYWRAGEGYNAYQPSHDASSDSICSVKADATVIPDTFDPSFDDVSGGCAQILVKEPSTNPDQPNQIVNTTTEPLVQNKQYLISSQAKADFNFNDFFNQFFSEVDYGHDITGWYALGDINSYEIVDCRPNCPSNNGATDNRSLKYSTRSGSEVNRSEMVTDWIHADRDLDDTTINVEFDMKVESGTATLENTYISRYANQDLSDVELPYGNTPTKALQFKKSISDTEQSPDIQLTTQWQHFIGSATFDVDPNSDTTMYRIHWHALPDGRKVYLDNVTTTSSPQIEVRYILRKRTTGTPPASQCNTDGQVTMSTNKVGNTYTSTLTTSTLNLADGQYDLFAQIYDSSKSGCYGHPLYTPINICGMDTSVQDPAKTTNCSDTCSKVVTFEACEDFNPKLAITVSNNVCPASGQYSVTLTDNTKSADFFIVKLKNLETGRTQKLPDAVPNANGVATVNITAERDMGTNIRLTATAVNDCGDVPKETINSADYQLACEVSGKVLEVSTPICSGGVDPDPDLTNDDTQARWTVSDNGSGNASVNNIGDNNPPNSFTIQNVPYDPDGTWTANTFLQLNLDNEVDNPQSFYCACDSQKVTEEECRILQANGVRSPSSDHIFYVIEADLNHDSWWQTLGGLIFGEDEAETDLPLIGTSINSNCYNRIFCKHHVFMDAEDSTRGRAGFPVSNGLIVGADGRWTQELPGETGAEGDPDDPGGQADREDYAYFYDLLDANQYPTRDKSGATFADGPGGINTAPSQTFDDGTKLYLITNSSGNMVTLTFGNNNFDFDWDVGTSKHIILVDDNVHIQGATANANRDWITIDNGGFLMVVASGDVTFDEDIGYNYGYTAANLDSYVDAQNQLIEGIFIASDVLTIDGSGNADRKFVGGGSFIGWNEVQIPRKFDDSTDLLTRLKNSVSPTEMFYFRPDLVANTPEAIKTPNLTWKEVN